MKGGTKALAGAVAIGALALGLSTARARPAPKPVMQVTAPALNWHGEPGTVTTEWGFFGFGFGFRRYHGSGGGGGAAADGVLLVVYDQTIGNGVGSDGFTALPLKSGAQTFFVGSGGSDANDGSTHALRKATVASAASLVVQGRGDQILVSEGTALAEQMPNMTGKDGASRVYPTSIRSYNPAAPLDTTQYGRATGSNRPKLCNGLTGELQWLGGGGTSPKYLAVQGIDFAFADASHNVLKALDNTNGKPDYVLFENSVFRYCQGGCALGNVGKPLTRHWIYRLCSFYGAWQSDGYGQSIYTEQLSHLTIEDCTFYHSGYRIGVARGAAIASGGGAWFAHTLYLHDETRNNVVRRNLMIESVSEGASVRGSVDAYENVIINCPVGLGLGGGSAYDIANPNGVPIYAGLNLIIGSEQAPSGTGSFTYQGVGIDVCNATNGSQTFRNMIVQAKAGQGDVSLSHHIDLPNKDSTPAANPLPSWCAHNENVIFNRGAGGVSTESSAQNPAGTAHPELLTTSYNSNRWYAAASGTNTQVTGASFVNAYDVDGLLVAAGISGVDAATRYSNFVNAAIADPHLRTTPRLLLTLAVVGYGVTYIASHNATAPVLSSVGSSSVAATTATVSATTTKGVGTLYLVVTTNSTTPTADQIKEGLNAAGAAATFADFKALVSSGAKSFAVTGLSGTTAYSYFLLHEDQFQNQSVIASGTFTTIAAGPTSVWDVATSGNGAFVNSNSNWTTEKQGTGASAISDAAWTTVKGNGHIDIRIDDPGANNIQLMLAATKSVSDAKRVAFYVDNGPFDSIQYTGINAVTGSYRPAAGDVIRLEHLDGSSVFTVYKQVGGSGAFTQILQWDATTNAIDNKHYVGFFGTVVGGGGNPPYLKATIIDDSAWVP